MRHSAVSKEEVDFKEHLTCDRLHKSFMLLGLDFMPLDQIVYMSLNGLRRQVATRDKT